jgi:type I restriction enzyme S subunit
MKAGWKTVKLGELTSHRPICYGVLKPGKRQEKGVPLIRITDITENRLDESDIYLITSELSQEFGRSVLTGGEVLLSIQGTIGRVAICPNHMKGANVSRTLAVIAPDERATPAYLRYWLLSLNGSLPTCGSTRASLNIGAIRDLEIPLPPLAEQKRIVALLDEAFAGIDEAKAKAEANQQSTKAFYLSSIHETFSRSCHEKVRLGAVCKTSSGGTPHKSHKEYYENGHIPWLRSGEVCQREINSSECFITELGMANSSAKLFPQNTVLVAMYGATAGQVGILRFESTTNQAVCGILPSSYMPEYLYYYFLSIKDDLVAQAVGGAQPNISQEKIRDTLIPRAGISEQARVVKELDAITEYGTNLENILVQKEKHFASLKSSLLAQAFAGELTA